MTNQSCQSCGMPLRTPEDRANNDESNHYCMHCTDENGALKPFEEVLSGSVQFLMHTQDMEQTVAEQAARRMLEKMPAWRSQVNKSAE